MSTLSVAQSRITPAAAQWIAGLTRSGWDVSVSGRTVTVAAGAGTVGWQPIITTASHSVTVPAVTADTWFLLGWKLAASGMPELTLAKVAKSGRMDADMAGGFTPVRHVLARQSGVQVGEDRRIQDGPIPVAPSWEAASLIAPRVGQMMVVSEQAAWWDGLSWRSLAGNPALAWAATPLDMPTTLTATPSWVRWESIKTEGNWAPTRDQTATGGGKFFVTPGLWSLQIDGLPVGAVVTIQMDGKPWRATSASGAALLPLFNPHWLQIGVSGAGLSVGTGVRMYLVRAQEYVPASSEVMWTPPVPTPPTPPVVTPPTPGVTVLPYEWSDANLPTSYASPSELTRAWPVTPTYVDYVPKGGDFVTELKALLESAKKRVVVRLPAGTFTVSQFASANGDPMYAFGIYHAYLQGFLGAGPDKTIIQLAPNCLTSTQLAGMQSMAYGSTAAPLQLGFARVDGTSASPVLMAGVTWQGADQQMITAVQSPNPAVVPQPAPYQGVRFFDSGKALVGYVSHCRFIGTGRAITSMPPFEASTVMTGNGTMLFDRCDFDGRLAGSVNAARPRRTGPVLLNSEASSRFVDCWLHHSNISRYAANDLGQSATVSVGTYELTRCKVEQISTNRNSDPALNGGASLQAYTNACALGWESCNARITLTDCIISVDNPNTDAGTSSKHLQFTSVGWRNPAGGRLACTGVAWRNTGFPHLDGYATVRVVKTTHWYSDGLATTMQIRLRAGSADLVPIEFSSWPPSAADLSAVGADPDTNYLVHTA